MSYIDWKDFIKKALPSDMRFQWHIDWIDSMFEGIRQIHQEHKDLTDDLDVKADFSSSVIMLRHRLNDLFDTYHRGIYFTQKNFGAGPQGFTVNVPDYLQYGDMEDRISQEINYYIHFGIIFNFNYFAATATAASDYIDALSGTISNTEIFAIISFYNKIRGHGLWGNLKRVHLFSPTSLANSKIDFMTATSILVDSGSIDFDRYGVASDGSSYFESSFTPVSDITDISNNATLIYISKLPTFTSALGISEIGAISTLATRVDTIGVKNLLDGLTKAFKGGTADFVTSASAGVTGALLVRTTAGKLRMRNASGYISTEKTIAGANLPDVSKYYCAVNNSAVSEQFSNAKLATVIEYDGALTLTQEIILINLVNEYNASLIR